MFIFSSKGNYYFSSLGIVYIALTYRCKVNLFYLFSMIFFYSFIVSISLEIVLFESFYPLQSDKVTKVPYITVIEYGKSLLGREANKRAGIKQRDDKD